MNSLFLSLFKAWVKADSVAQKFLTELNGFDFLLDRLFSETLAKELTEEEDEGLDAFLQIALDKVKLPEEIKAEEKTEKDIEQKLVLDDWAKSLKLVWTSDK